MGINEATSNVYSVYYNFELHVVTVKVLITTLQEIIHNRRLGAHKWEWKKNSFKRCLALIFYRNFDI